MKKSIKIFLIAFWSLFIIGVVCLIFFFKGIVDGKLGFMPTFEELENPPSAFASQVISSDDVVMRKFFTQNRTYAEYKDISKYVPMALVATEDARYYEHSGIDLKGLFRVAWGVATGNSSAGGGSTISQQLAKMLFPRESMDGPVDMVVRKFREWVIAVKLEKSYTKEEIIAMYLNKYDFLNLAVGINSAANIYFSKTPDKLTLLESAMLVGMAQNSSLYNPLRRPELTQQRRNVVLNQMLKYGYINNTQYDTLKTKPLGLRYHKEDFKDEPGTYFTEYLRTIMMEDMPNRKAYASWQKQQFVEDSVEWENNPLYGWCKKNHKPDGSKYNIYNDGLRIYATIDSRMQKYAEEAVVEHLSKDLQPKFNQLLKRLRHAPFGNDISSKTVEKLLNSEIKNTDRYRAMKASGASTTQIKKAFNTRTKMTLFTWKGERDTTLTPTDSIKHYLSFLRTAMMTMDHRTGEVKAYVGGPNYRYFMYDMVKVGKRQVGSTVKPFLYTLAMQNGFTPCDKILNIQTSFTLPNGRVWTPKNAGNDKSERVGQMVTLSWGLANSVNTVSAYLMKKFSPDAMATVMKRMGIYSPIAAVPSMFLGTSDISVYEMVGAYGTFANKGVYTKPYFVTKIEDKNGNVLAKFSPEKSEAIDKNTAYLMINLLEKVVEQGSGRRLRWHPVYGKLTADIAGKTGTTQKHADGWFMGITPELVTGVWTGGKMRSIRFSSLHYGQGANMALPIYARFMHKVYDDKSLGYSQDTKFEKPEGFNLSLNCDESKSTSPENNNNSLEEEEDDFF